MKSDSFAPLMPPNPELIPQRWPQLRPARGLAARRRCRTGTSMGQGMRGVAGWPQAPFAAETLSAKPPRPLPRLGAEPVPVGEGPDLGSPFHFAPREQPARDRAGPPPRGPSRCPERRRRGPPRKARRKRPLARASAPFSLQIPPAEGRPDSRRGNAILPECEKNKC